MSEQAVWSCGTCREMVGDDGFFIIWNNSKEHGRVGGHPVVSEDQNEENRPRGTIISWGEVGERIRARIAKGPVVGMGAYHHGCEPFEEDGYWFHIGRIRTWRDFGGWLEHLARKTWFGKTEIRHFTRMFLNAMGTVPINDVLEVPADEM